MCLVVFTETLGQMIHDPLVKCIESDIGQNSECLADALNRMHTRDGHNLLTRIHSQGMLKKVQTATILMTPAPNVKIRLDELNKILNEMKQGEQAVKKMAELDSQRGMQDPATVARKMRGDVSPDAPSGLVAASTDVLGDTALADILRKQAEHMAREGEGLLAEAKRMQTEADMMDPSAVATTVVKKPTTRRKVVKLTTTTDGVEPAKRGPGRPKRTPVVA